MPELNLLVAALLKPLAAILAAAALVTLWRSRGGLAAGPLSAALALFLAGELFCGVDVYVLQRTTLFDEAAHELLMSLAAGCGILGLYRHARYHVPCWNHRCPRFGSCQAPPPDCLDHDRTGRLPVFLFAAVALAALVPMTAAWTESSEVLVAGWGQARFGDYAWQRGAGLVTMNRWLMPGGAFVLAAATAARLALTRRLDTGTVWLAGLSCGLLGFTYFRALLLQLFPGDAALASFWEELSEVAVLVLFLVWWHDARHPQPGAACPT